MNFNFIFDEASKPKSDKQPSFTVEETLQYGKLFSKLANKNPTIAYQKMIDFMRSSYLKNECLTDILLLALKNPLQPIGPRQFQSLMKLIACKQANHKLNISLLSDDKITRGLAKLGEDAVFALTKEDIAEYEAQSMFCNNKEEIIKFTKAPLELVNQIMQLVGINKKEGILTTEETVLVLHLIKKSQLYIIPKILPACLKKHLKLEVASTGSKDQPGQNAATILHGPITPPIQGRQSMPVAPVSHPPLVKPEDAKLSNELTVTVAPANTPPASANTTATNISGQGTQPQQFTAQSFTNFGFSNTPTQNLNQPNPNFNFQMFNAPQQQQNPPIQKTVSASTGGNKYNVPIIPQNPLAPQVSTLPEIQNIQVQQAPQPNPQAPKNPSNQFNVQSLLQPNLYQNPQAQGLQQAGQTTSTQNILQSFQSFPQSSLQPTTSVPVVQPQPVNAPQPQTQPQRPPVQQTMPPVQQLPVQQNIQQVQQPIQYPYQQQNQQPIQQTTQPQNIQAPLPVVPQINQPSFQQQNTQPTFQQNVPQFQPSNPVQITQPLVPQVQTNDFLSPEQPIVQHFQPPQQSQQPPQQLPQQPPQQLPQLMTFNQPQPQSPPAPAPTPIIPIITSTPLIDTFAEQPPSVSLRSQHPINLPPTPPPQSFTPPSSRPIIQPQPIITHPHPQTSMKELETLTYEQITPPSARIEELERDKTNLELEIMKIRGESDVIVEELKKQNTKLREMLASTVAIARVMIKERAETNQLLKTISEEQKQHIENMHVLDKDYQAMLLDSIVERDKLLGQVRSNQQNLSTLVKRKGEQLRRFASNTNKELVDLAKTIDDSKLAVAVEFGSHQPVQHIEHIQEKSQKHWQTFETNMNPPHSVEWTTPPHQ